MATPAQKLFVQAHKLRFESNDPESALKLYREIIEKYGDSPEAGYAAQQIRKMLGQPEPEDQVMDEPAAESKSSDDFQEREPVAEPPEVASPLRVDRRKFKVPENGMDGVLDFGGYKTTRVVSRIISAAGWGLAVIGLIALFTGLTGSKQGNMLILLPGLLTMVFGLLFVAAGQITRAIVDVAEYNREILATLRGQRE